MNLRLKKMETKENIKTKEWNDKHKQTINQLNEYSKELIKL